MIAIHFTGCGRTDARERRAEILQTQLTGKFPSCQRAQPAVTVLIANSSTEWTLTMRFFHRIVSLAAMAAIAALGAGAAAVPAAAVTSPQVAFVPATDQSHDMANLGLNLNVRIGDASRFDSVERWSKVAVPGMPGYFYFVNLYDGSYLTAAISFEPEGAVLTKSFNGGTAQMWQISGSSSNARLTTRVAGQFRTLTYNGPQSNGLSFTADTVSHAGQNFNVITL